MGNDGELIIGTKIDTKSFEAQIDEVERKLKGLEKEYEIYSAHAEKGSKTGKKAMQETAIEIEKAKNKLIDLRKKQDLLDNPPENLTNWSEDFGKSLTQNIKKISRLILGVFGIRGAYMAVRSAMNVIAADDEQMKADIDYIKTALAYAVEPIVRAIVNLAKQLVTIIGSIVYMVTGKNIFEDANRSLKGANKQAKALKKQLAGFDEMNILSDSSGGGGTGPSLGPEDITNMAKKIEELKNKWFEFGEQMRTSIQDMPFEVWTKAFGDWDLAVYGVTEMVYGLWQVVTGFVEFFTGIAQMVYGLITNDTDLINKGFQNLKDGLEKMVLGFVDYLKGMMDIVNGIIKGVGMFFVRIIADTISSVINVFNTLKDKVVGVWAFISDKVKGFISGIQNWLIEKFGIVGTTIGNVIGRSIAGIVNTILGFAEGTINGFLRTINGAIGIINRIPGVDIKKLTMVSFPRLAKGGIINMPGRGIPVGSAVGGERGAEGVIPLTDSQQMALLGEAIGKYININATVPVYVGNRQIAREIKKIEAENDFAYNR